MTITDALAALNTAGQCSSAMDAELGAATERLGVRDLSSAQTRVSAAHTLLAEQGQNLAAIEKVLLALALATPVKPPEASPPPNENIVAWAKRVHPETVSLTPLPAGVIDYQRGLPGSRKGSMDVLFMPEPVISIRFRTKKSGRGRATVIEYGGYPLHRDMWLSTEPYQWDDPGLGRDSYQLPSNTLACYIAIGETAPGFVRLEPDTIYYLNVRIPKWDADQGRQQFSVAIGVAV